MMVLKGFIVIGLEIITFSVNGSLVPSNGPHVRAQPYRATNSRGIKDVIIEDVLGLVGDQT